MDHFISGVFRYVIEFIEYHLVGHSRKLMDRPIGLVDEFDTWLRNEIDYRKSWAASAKICQWTMGNILLIHLWHIFLWSGIRRFWLIGQELSVLNSISDFDMIRCMSKGWSAFAKISEGTIKLFCSSDSGPLNTFDLMGIFEWSVNCFEKCQNI